jgi:hypothetical protein
MASGSGPCGLFQKERSVATARFTAAAREMNLRSIPTGYAATAKPASAVLASQSTAVLSLTSQLEGFASCTK